MNTLALYLNSLPSKIYTREEERALFDKYIASTDEEERLYIKDDIISHNLRYVVEVAKKMAHDSDNLHEYISYGNIGLLEAFERYNLAEGCTFATYAHHWIKLEIRKGIKNSHDISIPQHMEEQIIQLNSVMNSSLQTLNRAATPEEISIMFGDFLDKDAIEEVLVYSENTYKVPISLDAPLAVESEDEGTKCLYYDLVDEKETNNETNDNKISEALKDALQELSEEEREIVTYRFYSNMTRKEIQEKLKQKGRILSTERIRQIENKTLRKMSNNTKIRELKQGGN